MTRRLLMIYTGGTIGMIVNQTTGALESYNFEHLLGHVPEIREFELELDSVSFEPPLDSSDVGPEQWVKLASIIADNYESYDGFVILHGTDTMSYTASALSFMLGGLRKPVVLTGSQLPIGALRTDGRANLITALEVAGARLPNGLPTVPEVAVVFHERLLRGNRSTKVDTDGFAAFLSPNYPPLAVAGTSIEYHHELIRRVSAQEGLRVNKQLDTNIIVFSLFPGIRSEIVTGVLARPELRGIILRTFGSGNAPRDNGLLEQLYAASRAGKVVVNVSQSPHGSVHQERYGTGLQLVEAGVVSGRDSTVEAALTKLMHLLGSPLSVEQVRLMMSTSLAGEVSV